jgi:predicted negative regulator of RcsB-dependent stress response
MKRTVTWLVVLVLVGTAVWYGWSRSQSKPVETLAKPVDATASKPAAAPGPVIQAEPVDLTKHDGQTIDFSSGKPVVKDSAEDKAATDAAVKDMAEATKGVTFEPVKKKP